MKDVWDVAVIGAGPAGAAAARAAADAGARTVLMERADIPRYKRCGGGLIGLSQQAITEVGLHPSALALDDVGRVSFTSNGRRSFQRETAPFLPMVMRSELDAALVRQATEAGAELRTGVTVGSCMEDDGVVTLGTSVGPVWAKAVVGADGSQGRCSAYVGVTYEHVDIGLEAELPTPPGSDWRGHVCSTGVPSPARTAGSSPRATCSRSASSATARRARRCATTTVRSSRAWASTWHPRSTTAAT